jgi:hypothetical protein
MWVFQKMSDFLFFLTDGINQRNVPRCSELRRKGERPSQLWQFPNLNHLGWIGRPTHHERFWKVAPQEVGFDKIIISSYLRIKKPPSIIDNHPIINGEYHHLHD